jgi:hypothetical protein
MPLFSRCEVTLTVLPWYICERTEKQGSKFSRDFGFISKINSYVGNLAKASTDTKSNSSSADDKSKYHHDSKNWEDFCCSLVNLGWSVANTIHIGQ